MVLQLSLPRGTVSNLYGYVLNDPVNLIDPPGLYFIPAPAAGGPATGFVAPNFGSLEGLNVDPIVPDVVVGADSPVGGVQTTFPFGSRGDPTTKSLGPSYNIPLGPGSNMRLRPVSKPGERTMCIDASVTTPLGGLANDIDVLDLSMNPRVQGPRFNFPLGFGVNLYIGTVTPVP